MQLRFPVLWHAPGRSGYLLILRMPARRGQRLRFDRLLGLVAIKPLFTGLEARDDRMTRGVKMFGGVLVRRAVTTADVPAFGAAP